MNAHSGLWNASAFGFPTGAVSNSAIARLIRSQTSCPSWSPRSSLDRRSILPPEGGKHLISPPGCDYLSVGTVLADQQVDGSPDVAVGDHSVSFRR
jgi:hypothetical protein